MSPIPSLRLVVPRVQIDAVRLRQGMLLRTSLVSWCTMRLVRFRHRRLNTDRPAPKQPCVGRSLQRPCEHATCGRSTVTGETASSDPVLRRSHHPGRHAGSANRLSATPARAPTTTPRPESGNRPSWAQTCASQPVRMDPYLKASTLAPSRTRFDPLNERLALVGIHSPTRHGLSCYRSLAEVPCSAMR